MNNQDLIFKMSAAAKAANQPVQAKVFEVARAKKTAINTYLQSIGILPNTNPHKAAIQAGKAIYTELGPNAAQALETMLTYSAGRVPKQLQSKRFYPLLSQAPGAFWAACLAFEESPLNQKENTALMQVSNFDRSTENTAISGGLFAATGVPIPPAAIEKGRKALDDIAAFLRGNKDNSTQVQVYYFNEAGAGQKDEGKAVLKNMSLGYFKNTYRPDIEKNPYGLTYDQIAAVWPKYAPLLPEIDRKGGNLDYLFGIIKNNEYPDTGKAPQDTTAKNTAKTNTGTGTGLNIGADQPQDAQTAGTNNILFAVVGLFVLFLLFKKS